MKKLIFVSSIALLFLSMECTECGLFGIPAEYELIHILFFKNQTVEVEFSSQQKFNKCDDFKTEQVQIVLNKNTFFSNYILKDYENHFNEHRIVNKGDDTINFMGHYSSEDLTLPIKAEGNPVSCGLVETTAGTKNCKTKKQEEAIIQLYKDLDYKGYVELGPGESHSFKKSDFFVERDGKQYEWHQWTRDSILKSWGENTQ